MIIVEDVGSSMTRKEGSFRLAKSWTKTKERCEAAALNTVEAIAVAEVVGSAGPAAVIAELLIGLEGALGSVDVGAGIKTVGRVLEGNAWEWKVA